MDLLRAEGLEERVGYLGRHMSVDQAIVEFQEETMVQRPGNAEQPTSEVAKSGL